MIIGILAISSCTGENFADKIRNFFNKDNGEKGEKGEKEENNNVDVMELIDLKIQTQEDNNKIKATKDYLQGFNDDTENVTNDPLIQVIVDAKKSLKQINDDLDKELKEINESFKVKIQNAKTLASFLDAEVTYDALESDIENEFFQKKIVAVEQSNLRANNIYLKSYDAIFMNPTTTK